MASEKTEVTEIVTGLAMLGYQSIDRSLEVRPRHIAHVDAAVFDRLEAVRADGRLNREFEIAWSNGSEFARSNEGLRGRPPWSIEWKGHHKPASKTIETIPADLRVDHVFLVSCKYGSRILHNAGPFALFDHGLAPSGSIPRASWFEEVGGEAFRAVWEPLAVEAGLPSGVSPSQATAEQRARLNDAAAGLNAGDPGRYAEFIADCSTRSADRWRRNLGAANRRAEMFWRLLRMQAAPYFVLGAHPDGRPTRYRVETPWDFRQEFTIDAFDVRPGGRGQVCVEWTVHVSDRGGRHHEVVGHVEVRWSHGKFTGPPEAKVYLDTDPHDVPGYVPL